MTQVFAPRFDLPEVAEPRLPRCSMTEAALTSAEMPAMTHREACKRAANWLRNSKKHEVVMCELVSLSVDEQPDVIGWSRGYSILIEVKVSRSDFHADKAKYFRRREEMGMGDVRYFAAPRGLLKPEDIPEGWGLLEIGDHQCRVTVEPTHKPANKIEEVKILVAALRRVRMSTAVYVEAAVPVGEGEA